MFAIAARRLGYRVHTFSPDDDTPTGQVADLEVTASYDDLDAVARSSPAAWRVGDVRVRERARRHGRGRSPQCAPVRPPGTCCTSTQHRVREKTFLAARAFPVTPFAAVEVAGRPRQRHSPASAAPAILKTASLGLRRQGAGPRSPTPQAAAAALGSDRQSAGRARSASSTSRARSRSSSARGSRRRVRRLTAPIAEHATATTSSTSRCAPARVSADDRPRGGRRSRARVLEALDVVGVLCVEFFVTRDGRLLVNELAPRPHNSGHLTIDACVTSQFEQQVRAVCGLPLGSTASCCARPRWPTCSATCGRDGEPDWAAALALPDVKLHLYGKVERAPGPQDGPPDGHRPDTGRRRGARPRSPARPHCPLIVDRPAMPQCGDGRLGQPALPESRALPE